MGRDGIQLARALASGVIRQRTPPRPILLEHARQSNQAAVSLLNLDKEFNLMKYHGISQYLRQRFQASRTLTDAASAASGTTQTSSIDQAASGGGGAKVAFMITATMKQQLSESLGYDEAQIKKLTPTEASLILHHKVSPEQKDDKLPTLLQQHEEEQERIRLQTEKEELNRAKIEEEKIKQQQAQQQEESNQFGQEQRIEQVEVSSGGFMSKNLLELDHKNTSGFADNWFEVTETKEGVTSRVGLYLDEEEAQMGCDTRQLIADRKGSPLKFEVHRITSDDL